MSFESWDDNEFPIFRVDNSKVGLCMVYVCRINLSLPEVGFTYRGAEYGTLLELFRITEFYDSVSFDYISRRRYIVSRSFI